MMVGTILTPLGLLGEAFTVTRKDVLTVFIPSLRLTVIRVWPTEFVAGRMVIVRLAPLPAKTMFEFGTSAVFAQVADRFRFAAGVSASPIVKGIAVVAVFSAMVCSATEVIVGKLLVKSDGIEVLTSFE